MLGVLLCSATPPANAAGDQILSNERTLTTWASPLTRAIVRAAPSAAAAYVVPLQMVTSDGFPEVYVVLLVRSVPGVQPDDSTDWAEVRLPSRVPDQTGWVPRAALGDFTRVSTELVVDRAAARLTLYAAGRPIFAAAVGIGRRRSPTPPGHFWIREGFAVVPAGRAAYGPYAFGTSAYSVFPGWPGGGVVGIHGSSRPTVGPSTYGCITLPDAGMVLLAKLVPIGTPVLVI